MSFLHQKNYFCQLTGLRAIAAYVVFLTHIMPNKDVTKNNFIENICGIGYLGVSIFFVLSGFLICYRYIDDFQLTINWFKTYMVNRIARIYPMYFILTIATFAYNHYFHIFKLDPIILFTNLTFLRGYFDDFLFTGISQGWSLTVEETFYVLAPLLFLGINYKNRLIYLSGLFISFGILLVFLFQNLNFYHFMGNLNFMFNYTFFGRCIEFFIGIKLAINFKNNFFKKTGSNYTVFGLSAMISVILLLTLFKGYLELNYFSKGVILILNNLLFPLSVYYFLLGLLVEKTIISNFLSTKVMVVLGKSSYVFYLIHIGFISYFLTRYFQLNTITLFILLNVISVGLYYFIEHPLNILIRKFNVQSPKTEISI